MLTKTYAPYLIQVEVVTLIICGCIGLIVDSSFITFGSDIDKVWSLALDPYKFPPMNQFYMKYFITMLIVIRNFTLHITIAMYVVMLWPAVFAEKTSLLIPWLIVGTTRLCVDFMATLTGLYICSAYGFFNTLWIEFLLFQILEHGPFFYIWLTIVKYALYLIELQEIRKRLVEELESYKVKLGRKSRQLIAEERRRTLDSTEDDSNSLSQTTINTIIEHIRAKKRSLTTRSLDTLLEIIERKKKDNEEMLSVQITQSQVESSEVTEEQSEAIESLNIVNEDVTVAKQVTIMPSPEFSEDIAEDSNITIELLE